MAKWSICFLPTVALFKAFSPAPFQTERGVDFRIKYDFGYWILNVGYWEFKLTNGFMVEWLNGWMVDPFGGTRDGWNVYRIQISLPPGPLPNGRGSMKSRRNVFFDIEYWLLMIGNKSPWNKNSNRSSAPDGKFTTF